MRYTKPIHGAAAREALKRGIDAVADSVVITLGAKGRNVVYPKYGSPVVTNDGVSIAREIKPEDPYENLGAEMIKQSAERTNEEAGDGTTTTTKVTHAGIEFGIQAVDAGHNPMVLKKELEEAAKEAVEILKTKSRPVENLLEVARVTTENEAIAQMVTDVITDVGPRAHFIVEEGHGVETEVEKMKGYWLNKGYVSPYMATKENGEAVLENCAVFITDKNLNLNSDFMFETIEPLVKQGQRNFFIIADNVEGELLGSMILNKKQGVNFVAIKRPSSVEELEDIALMLGATAVTKDKGLTKLEATHAGEALKVIVSKDRTLIVANRESSVELAARIAELQKECDESAEQYGPIELKRERLSRLVSGLVVIRVGARTDSERTYLKLKVDDAIGAVRAAMEEGIVAGGGTTLRDVADELTKDTPGARILANALRSPYRQILDNAGISYTRRTFWGWEREDLSKNYNVLTGEVVDDMFKAGIVDPTKVVRCTIENAVSCIKIFLTTETAIAPIPPKEKKEDRD